MRNRVMVSCLVGVALAGLGASWWRSHRHDAPAVSSGVVWLSDFERDGEQAVFWGFQRAYAQQTTEHASHGRRAAKIVFQPGEEPFISLDQSLSREPGLRDWSRAERLCFDLYNDEATETRLTLQLESQDGRSAQQALVLAPHTAVPVRIELAALASSLDLSRMEGFSLGPTTTRQRWTVFIDAVRLEGVAGGPALPGEGARPAGAAPVSLDADADVTPEDLGTLQFAQQLSRWQTIDPVNGRNVIRVPLTLVGPELRLPEGFPLTGGVPFAMGQLPARAAVRLQDDGGSVWPVQTRPLATWPDGSIKWLQVATRTPFNARGRQLWLEYGAGVSSELVAGSSVRVDEGPQDVVVSTGPLRFAVSKQRLTLFESASVDRNHDGTFSDDERLAGGGDMMVRHRGVEFRSSNDTQSYKLIIEESGPLRATLKATGWFRGEDGKGFCQFAIRLQAFAGSPYVRVYHTFIYTGYPANTIHHEYKGIKLPDNDTIQEIALELPIGVASAAQLVTADGESVLSTALDAPTTISQGAHDAYKILKEATLLGAGTRTEGWLLVQNASGGVLAGVRDAWQQYPKEWVADPRSGRVTIKLWPAAAGELSFETGPEAYGPDDVARGSAFGLGKTHELLFGFFDRRVEPEGARADVQPWLEPWLLAAHPEWLQATDVLGTLGPAQLERQTEGEVMLDDLFAWAERQPKNFAWYGMLNYGDTLTWYRQEAYDKSYDDWGWHPEGRWGWHGCEAVGTHGGALISFLRTHNLKYFRFAEAKARHLMDVDTVHYDTVANDPRLRHKIPDTFAKIGSMHRHSAYHWSGRNEEATHTHVLGLLLYYYLTGYDRAWDVANEVGSFFLLDPVTYSQLPENAPARAIANVLWGDVTMYEATHDPRYREGADRWAAVLLKGQQQDGTWLETYNPKRKGWEGEVKRNYIAYHVLPSLIAYHRLTGRPAVARAIVRGTDAMVKDEPYLQFFDALAYSFQLTDDGKYLDEGQRRLKGLIKVQRHVDDPVMNGMIFQKATYDQVAPTLYSVPYLIGAMDAPDFPTLEQAWRKVKGPAAADRAGAPTARWVGEGSAANREVAASSQLPAQVNPRVSDQSGPSASSYEVRIMPSTQKVLPELGMPRTAHLNPATLSLARNEYEAVQIVVNSATPLQQVAIELSDLAQRGGSGTIARTNLSWSPVRFVKTRKPGYPVEHVGWWPDPLPAAAPFDIPAQWPQPVWLTIYVAPGTPAGEYAGVITIRPANAPAKSVEVIVHVWDFELPSMPSLKTAFDVYPARIDNAYRQYFPQWWSRWESHPQELEQRFYDDLLRHRIAPMLNADLSSAEAATALKRLSERGLSAFAVGRHGGSFNNDWPDDPTQLALLQPTYRRSAHELRQTGLLEQHYIYTYDEPQPGLPHVAQVARMIHTADAALKNLVVLESLPSLTALASWLEPMDIVCLNNLTFDPVQAEGLRRLGKQVWLYVAGPRPPYPTLVIDYPGMAPRILPWMCWKYGLSGLLYWSVDYWTTNPYDEPMNTPWEQNGNGSLYYPGPEGPVSSIRLEVLRDGLEDYEYLARLRDLVHRVEAHPTATDERHVRELLASAEKMLAVNPELVQSMRGYSDDPDELTSERARIAETIEHLQQVLAGLPVRR